jgi:uncharacterized damage-inducible protein DinB
MFRTVKDFEKSFKFESDSTLKLLRALTDASLQQRVAPEGRTLGRLAWHLSQSQADMLNKAGLNVEGPDWEAAVPTTAALIVSAYEHTSQSVLAEVSKKWNDAALLEEHDLYGEAWANGFTLEAMLRHEAHHRGQITVLMRQAGLAVPGIYGPSREEWAAFGMPAME